MPIYETFAKRKRNAERAGEPTVFQQNELPFGFRNQVGYILDDAIGDLGNVSSIVSYTARLSVWARIHDTLVREMGVQYLSYERGDNRSRCRNFLFQYPDIDDVLSLIELAFANIELAFVDLESDFGVVFGRQSPEDAIEELNLRFQEHGIGYQYQGGRIISVESLYLYTEAVQPAIRLLYDLHFEGAVQEFMGAHKHFREGNNKEAIVGAENAFESTMKAICDQRGWAYETEKATATNLLDLIFQHGLIPTEMQSHFTALRSTLASGLPTVRNRGGRGGHGQGIEVVDVPDYLAAYCLHLAATNIVLLAEAHNPCPKRLSHAKAFS